MKYEQPIAADIPEQEKVFRTFISNDPALSHFLETGSAHPKARFAKEALYRDPAFLVFISPYFKKVYVNAIIRAFDLKDTRLMSDIAINAILLDDEHRKQAFDDILVYLEQRKTVLASFHAKLKMQEPFDILSLTEYTNIATISNLNYLPAEFFDFRSTYARVIMKVINSLVNRDQQTSMIMITDLRQLTVDTQTAHDVDALYKLLKNAVQQTSASESNSGYSDYTGDSGYSVDSGDSNEQSDSRGFSKSIRTVVIGFIIIIIVIIRMMLGWDDRGRHSRRSYYHPTYRSDDHPSSRRDRR